MKIELLDLFSVIWFFGCWTGYVLYADRSPVRSRSVAAHMARYRVQWMRVMMARENRILDSSIVGNILTGIAFFASTTILAVGGLFALLGAADRAVAVVQDLPFFAETSQPMWQLKVLLLIGIFVFGFFKLAWSFRLYYNSSVLIGAAPLAPADEKTALKVAERIARLLSLAAGHSNGGLRAYFFALAALGWFLHPLVFIAASALVVLVLYRREFRSRTVKILREGPAEPPGA